MKKSSPQPGFQGFTLIEILVVLAILAILAAMVVPLNHSERNRKARFIVCQSNLRQTALGFWMYASDNRDQFPTEVFPPNSGAFELAGSHHAFACFQKISPYIKNPKTFLCPFDATRKAATNYDAFSDLNLSYFVNADVSPTNAPARSILAGDRFLQADGKAVQPGLFLLTTSRAMSWTPTVHLGRGTFAFADGHVETTRSNFNATVQNQPLATNRLVIP